MYENERQEKIEIFLKYHIFFHNSETNPLYKGPFLKSPFKISQNWTKLLGDYLKVSKIYGNLATVEEVIE